MEGDKNMVGPKRRDQGIEPKIAKIAKRLVDRRIIKKPESRVVPDNLDTSIPKSFHDPQTKNPEDKEALLKIERLGHDTQQKLLVFFKSEIGQNILEAGYSIEKTVRQWRDTPGFNFSKPDEITQIFKSLPSYFHFTQKAANGPGNVPSNKFYDYYKLVKAEELYRLLQRIVKN